MDSMSWIEFLNKAAYISLPTNALGKSINSSLLTPQLGVNTKANWVLGSVNSKYIT